MKDDEISLTFSNFYNPYQTFEILLQKEDLKYRDIKHEEKNNLLSGFVKFNNNTESTIF